MTVLRVDREHPDREVIRRAAEVIRRGGLVAFPTETVYGLGGNAMDPVAIERIFKAKGRPHYNPLIAHCPDQTAARLLSASWPEAAELLGRTFWPGPLTLVVEKAPAVPDLVTAGLSTVALRVPSHPVARALLELAGVPIAAPSANRSTELSPTRAEHVVKGLAGRVDLVLDAGDTSIGIESTVVDVSGEAAVLLRPGSISAEQLSATLGRALLAAGSQAGEAARPSPGMMDRHYAPRARLVLIPARRADLLESRAAEAAEAGSTVAALLLDLHATASIHHAVTMPQDAPEYARRLYATLHLLDERGCDLVLVEGVPADPWWDGVRDRLSRAAEPA